MRRNIRAIQVFWRKARLRARGRLRAQTKKAREAGESNMAVSRDVIASIEGRRVDILVNLQASSACVLNTLLKVSEPLVWKTSVRMYTKKLVGELKTVYLFLLRRYNKEKEVKKDKGNGACWGYLWQGLGQLL